MTYYKYVNIPFSSCTTTLLPLKTNISITCGIYQQWSFIQNFEKIWFYENHNDNFNYMFDTVQLDDQQFTQLITLHQPSFGLSVFIYIVLAVLCVAVVITAGSLGIRISDVMQTNP